MKHVITKTVGNEKIKVEISLADDCNNGHSDFSITGTLYEKKGDGRFYYVCCGCIHDTILKFFPEFKIFVDLHLSDFRGVPMYAVENGIYHLKKDIKTGAKYLRISTEQAKELLKYIEDKNAFMYMLNELGIVKQWQNEAQKAIDKLKELTSDKIKIVDKKCKKIELTEDEKKEVEDKIKNNYFSDNEVEKRKNERYKNEVEKRRNEIIENCKREKMKLERECTVKLIILEHTLNDNFIYYNHNNTIKFNWLDYKDKFNDKTIEAIMKDIKEFDSSITIK